MRRTKFLLAATFLIAASAHAIAAGAIAVDDEEGMSARDVGYGIVTGEPSRDAAGRAAMKQCRDSGNTSCKVVVRFDVCGAYAGDRQYFGIGWGDTEARARKMAMDACGTSSCKVIVSDCE